MMRMLIDRLDELLVDIKCQVIVADICSLVQSTMHIDLLDLTLKKLNSLLSTSTNLDLEELIEDLNHTKELSVMK